MASYLGIHGQIDASGAQQVLFSCPYDQFVASTLFVCNVNAAAQGFTIWLVPARDVETGAVNRHRIYGDTANAAAESTVAITAGITLAYGDQIVVLGNSTDISFTLCGEGIDLEDDE